MCIMEGENGGFFKPSKLLELAAADDVSGFKSEVEERGISSDEVSFWYTRTNGSMGFQERTPLMIASTYGSLQIIEHLRRTDVNKPSASDGATALHCAAAGASLDSVHAVKLLLEAGADVNSSNFNGETPGDLIPPRALKSSTRKALEMMLKGFTVESEEKETITPKKEYPVDVSLPDINDGVYGSDEFRMYTFKVQPCSRAYSHDWTECPFVHPGENARRRDLRKYNYSCVPCPEFRKGSCVKGDACEYAHGVFESWLHPAQYKTRLCKDENGCARKVCFFAHKIDELRPVFPATGSAVSSVDLGSPPPMSPVNHMTPPPTLQLQGSRLKTALNARDLEMELELLGLESLRTQQQKQHLIDDLSNNLYTRFGDLKGAKIDDVFGSHFSPRLSSPIATTPTHSSPFRASYPSSKYSLSPVRKPSFGFDSSAAVAQAVMNSRSGVFAKQRSQSFIDRGASLNSKPQSLNLSEWGSPDGKLDWGFNGEEANKLRKSASFGFRSGNLGAPLGVNREPDGSWVGAGLYSSSEKQRHGVGGGGELPQWVEQMYIEQEQMVA